MVRHFVRIYKCASSWIVNLEDDWRVGTASLSRVANNMRRQVSTPRRSPFGLRSEDDGLCNHCGCHRLAYYVESSS
jgi:hypothetical protein